MTDLFTSLSDAKARLDGTVDWEWGGNASHNAFVEYAYHNQAVFEAPRIVDGADRCFDTDAALFAYLLSVGENPSDYSLSQA